MMLRYNDLDPFVDNDLDAAANIRLRSVRKHGYDKFVEQFLPLGEQTLDIKFVDNRRLLPDFGGSTPLGETFFAAYGHRARAVVPVLAGWVDAYADETHQLRSTKTEYPLESGATITDHLVVLPARLQLTGFVSDLLYHEPSAKSKEPLARASAAWQELRRLHAERQILDVTTSLGDYQNMVILNISATVNASTGSALRFRVDFEEVQTRDVEFVSFSRSIEPAVRGTEIYDPLSSLLHDAGVAGLPENATDEEVEEYSKRVTLKRPDPPEVRLLRLEAESGGPSRAAQWTRDYAEEHPNSWAATHLLPLFGVEPSPAQAPPVFNIAVTDEARQHWTFHHNGIEYDIDMFWHPGGASAGWYMRVINGATRNRSREDGGPEVYRSGGKVVGGVPLLDLPGTITAGAGRGVVQALSRYGEIVAVPLVNTTEPPGRFDWNTKYELVFFSRRAVDAGAIDAVTQ